MDEREVFLDKIHIKNFLSLRDVELPLKPLTILVGPNASGKSNVIRALEFLRRLIIAKKLPSIDEVKSSIWAGGADTIAFKIYLHTSKKKASYEVEVQPRTETRIFKEELIVGKVKVISVEKGKGQVKDENNQNPVSFRSSTKLALSSAGDYGDKPITNAITEFIQYWEFYNFDPNFMRSADDVPPDSVYLDTSLIAFIDADGSWLREILANWYQNDRERFDQINEAIKNSTNIGIKPILDEKGKGDVYLFEGYKKPIPLDRASDGTLRLLAYHILLNAPITETLIVIEEPERNLHPAMLREVSNFLEKLAKKTQVIVTTHSSQLLDTFNPDNLADNLAVLLLRNRPGLGTEVINLVKVTEDREALKGWIEDFGIGSAIFDSQLLQDVMEN